MTSLLTCFSCTCHRLHERDRGAGMRKLIAGTATERCQRPDINDTANLDLATPSASALDCGQEVGPGGEDAANNVQ